MSRRGCRRVYYSFQTLFIPFNLIKRAAAKKKTRKKRNRRANTDNSLGARAKISYLPGAGLVRSLRDTLARRITRGYFSPFARKRFARRGLVVVLSFSNTKWYACMWDSRAGWPRRTGREVVSGYIIGVTAVATRLSL